VLRRTRHPGVQDENPERAALTLALVLAIQNRAKNHDCKLAATCQEFLLTITVVSFVFNLALEDAVAA
jgi:hypothetical protein